MKIAHTICELLSFISVDILQREKKVAEIEASVLINRDIALETLVLSQTKFELNECILG